MKRILLTAMMAVVLTAIVAKKAEAVVSLTVKICQGGLLCQTFGPSPGPGPFTNNNIVVGDFTISGSVSSIENSAFASGSTSTTQVQRTGNANAGNLEIWLVATGFAQPVSPQGYLFSETLSGTASGAPGSTSQTFQAWYSNTNASGFPPGGSQSPGIVNCLLSTGALSSCAAASANTGVPGPVGATFSMISLTTFVIPSASSTATYQSNSVMNVTPVPEPTSMVLLGTGLLGAAAYARRRRKA